MVHGMDSNNTSMFRVVKQVITKLSVCPSGTFALVTLMVLWLWEEHKRVKEARRFV